MNESGSGPRHLSVLPAEVLHWLEPAPGQVIVDATTGAGGHAQLIARQLGESGRLIALDRDASMLEIARPRLEGFPVTLVQASFDQLRVILDRLQVPAVDAVLADLGICSDQLDSADRGFSFMRPGPLDMRMNPQEGEPARLLLRHRSEPELADIFFHYGEERHSRRIARRIVEERKRTPIDTTEQLAEIVRRCLPRAKPGMIDPATRIFQALRIAVNDELAVLETFLRELPGCLKPGGRVVLISFHSLEDRRVKQAFRQRDIWEELTRKPVVAGEEEIAGNPRSRSARLRAARLKG